MKNILLLLAGLLLAAPLFAQNTVNADSLAFQNQRTKINSMLTQRQLKFGEYDASLSQHTGIFGMQTKKDIRRSDEILMGIVQMDNAIFNETKILLKYSADQLQSRTSQLESQRFQQQNVQYQVQQSQDNTLAYMGTINELRNQNDELKQRVKQAEHEITVAYRWIVIVVVLMVASILLILMKKRAFKA